MKAMADSNEMRERAEQVIRHILPPNERAALLEKKLLRISHRCLELRMACLNYVALPWWRRCFAWKTFKREIMQKELRLQRPYYTGQDKHDRPTAEMRWLPVCKCSDRRGPLGGVCGACGGAIPTEKAIRAPERQNPEKS
jgi:hypothetical protein